MRHLEKCGKCSILVGSRTNCLKMYRVLVLLALSSAVRGLELEYLCPSDHFKYNDLQVNSIFR